MDEGMASVSTATQVIAEPSQEMASASSAVIVRAAPSEDVRKKWEEKHNVRLLQYAEERGIGKRHYRLEEIV